MPKEKEYPGCSIVVRIGNSPYDFRDGKLEGWKFNGFDFLGFVDDPWTQYKIRNDLRSGGEVIDL